MDCTGDLQNAQSRQLDLRRQAAYDPLRQLRRLAICDRIHREGEAPAEPMLPGLGRSLALPAYNHDSRKGSRGCFITSIQTRILHDALESFPSQKLPRVVIDPTDDTTQHAVSINCLSHRVSAFAWS